MLSKFLVSALSNRLTVAFNVSKGPESAIIFLMLKNLSPTMDCNPSNVLAMATDALPNRPSGPNTLSNASAVSSAVTLTPSLKPNRFLIPRSLNRSAADIPPERALCICSPAT